MKKSLALALAFGLLSTNAMARGYQAQGCGLGSTLFTDGSSLVHQVLGATTNGTSGNQTFGMTSGTSNCELEASGRRAQMIFIEANKVALANDIARGGGDTLASLTRMYGCGTVESVGPALQQSYSDVFPAENTTVEHIDSTISKIVESACI